MKEGYRQRKEINVIQRERDIRSKRGKKCCGNCGNLLGIRGNTKMLNNIVTEKDEVVNYYTIFLLISYRQMYFKSQTFGMCCISKTKINFFFFL